MTSGNAPRRQRRIPEHIARVAGEGADVAHRASRLTREKIAAEGRKCILIAGEVTNQKFCEKAVARAVKEFGWRGVRVNPVAPGPVWTALNPSDREAEAVSMFGANAPMKRPAQPEEIAPAYVFLTSPHDSSEIIGGYGGG